MRHFLGPPTPPPGPLASGMSPGSTLRPLVACPGSAQRFPTLDPGTILRAVDVSAITSPADRHLLPAALTLE
jgi:hypothetical protein